MEVDLRVSTTCGSGWVDLSSIKPVAIRTHPLPQVVLTSSTAETSKSNILFLRERSDAGEFVAGEKFECGAAAG